MRTRLMSIISSAKAFWDSSRFFLFSMYCICLKKQIFEMKREKITSKNILEILKIKTISLIIQFLVHRVVYLFDL